MLKNFRIAALVADGFEEVELLLPKLAFEREGAQVTVISPNPKWVRSWRSNRWGDYFPVDLPLVKANPQDFDGYLQPGGVMSPDKLRMNPDAVKFAKHFIKVQKPVVSLCHGPWMLIEAGGVKDHVVTSWPSLKTDLRNAGAEWVNQPVVISGNLVTSRMPADLPLFNAVAVEHFAQSRKG